MKRGKRRVFRSKRTCISCGKDKITKLDFRPHGNGFKKTCIACEDKNKDFLKDLKNRNSKKKARFLSIKHFRTDKDGCVTATCLANPGEKEMTVGFSFCSPKDEFNKKKGKTLALKRMNGIDSVDLLFETPILKSIFEFLKKDSVYNDFTPNEDYPTWFPRFIKSFEEKMDKIARDRL